MPPHQCLTDDSLVVFFSIARRLSSFSASAVLLQSLQNIAVGDKDHKFEKMITVLMVVPGMVSLSGKQAVNRIIRSKAIKGFNAASWLVRQFVELLEISLR